MPLSFLTDYLDKKIKTESFELNNTIDQTDLTDINGVFHSATARYAFFSTIHGIFTQ
jgi:hypothetical protein